MATLDLARRAAGATELNLTAASRIGQIFWPMHLSLRWSLKRRMLACMRLTVEVRDEHADTLRRLAFDEHRSVREHAAYLLALKIQEEWSRRGAAPTEQPTQTAA